MVDSRTVQANNRNLIYVSSTLSDLGQARRAAIDAIWALDLYPVVMEDQTAQPVDPVTHALNLIDTATAFISILGHRYGSVLPGLNMSLIELEYNRAVERNIPVLAFILNDTAHVRQSDFSNDPDETQKLQAFRQRLLSEQVVAHYSSPDELKARILTSLARLYEQLQAPISAPLPIAAAEAKMLVTSTSTIFISYRREDSIPTCLHLAYRLEQHFGEAAVYMDEGSIPPGANWRDHIKEAIAKCGVVLAAIGPKWLNLTDSAGLRRLDSEDDVLRQEIESALRRRIPVIPVLIDGTRLPKAADLPATLRPLRDQQSLNLRNTQPDFGNDVQRIVQAVEYWITPLRSTA